MQSVYLKSNWQGDVAFWKMFFLHFQEKIDVYFSFYHLLHYA